METGPPVIARQPAEQEAEDKKRRKGDDIAHVLDGFLVDLRCGTKRCRQRMDEDIAKRHDERAHPQRSVKGDVKNLHRIFPLSASQMAGDEHASARSHGHGEGNEYLQKRYGHRGGGHGRCAQPVADEYAVDDHVDRVEQQSDHLRDGVPDKERARFPFIHRNQPPDK